MGLFSTLLHNSSTANESTGETTTIDSKSGRTGGHRMTELPTVVQLFPRHPFPLTTDTAWTGTASTAQQQQQQLPPSFAALHYTAVQCWTELKDPWAESSLRGSNSNRKSKEFLVPDLGVWNAKVEVNNNKASNTGDLWLTLGINILPIVAIAVVLIILWLLGLVSSYTMGGFIHILLVIAVIVILLNVISGRKR